METYLWFFYNYFLQAMIQKCNTGHVGIEDSADGSAMLRSTSLVTTVVPDGTGRPDHSAYLYCYCKENTLEIIAYCKIDFKLCCAHFQVLCSAVLAPACTSIRADLISSTGSWDPGNWWHSSGFWQRFSDLTMSAFWSGLYIVRPIAAILLLLPVTHI